MTTDDRRATEIATALLQSWRAGNRTASIFDYGVAQGSALHDRIEHALLALSQEHRARLAEPPRPFRIKSHKHAARKSLRCDKCMLKWKWKKACAFDGIDSKALFVVFSQNNPYRS